MASVKLRDEVKVRKRVSVTERPALYASKCDACDKVFKAEKWNQHDQPGKANGTFDPSAPGEGNGFSADVCSFTCADTLMAGGWRKMKAYKAQVKAKAELVRLNVQMTSTVRTEAETVNAWETAAPSNSFHMWTPMTWGKAE